MFRKNAFSTILAISALLAMTFAILLISKPANAGPSKVEVCHIPPDDPGNFHTITVNQNALPAHIAHYDVGGACDGACAALCDDGNLCTYEDTGDCESTGCPVPQPVVCGDGQTCDPQQGCVEVVTEVCPCFTADDLAAASAANGNSAACGPLNDFVTGATGSYISFGGFTTIACTGLGCTLEPEAYPVGCALDFLTATVETNQAEDAACLQLIQNFCGN